MTFSDPELNRPPAEPETPAQAAERPMAPRHEFRTHKGHLVAALPDPECPGYALDQRDDFVPHGDLLEAALAEVLCLAAEAEEAREDARRAREEAEVEREHLRDAINACETNNLTIGELETERDRLAERVRELEAEVDAELQGQVEISEGAGRIADRLAEAEAELARYKALAGRAIEAVEFYRDWASRVGREQDFARERKAEMAAIEVLADPDGQRAAAEWAGLKAAGGRWRQHAEEMANQYDECWSPDGEIPDWQINAAKALRELLRRMSEGAQP